MDRWYTYSPTCSRGLRPSGKKEINLSQRWMTKKIVKAKIRQNLPGDIGAILNGSFYFYTKLRNRFLVQEWMPCKEGRN